MKSIRERIYKPISLIMFALLIPLYLGNGTGSSGTAIAQEEPAYDTEADEMLKEMPESMPKDYTDDEINRMLEDVQQVDDSKDVEGREKTEAPPVTDEDRALIEDIRENPEKYAGYIKDREWLDTHPVVIWSLCSDFEWINAHPQFAARIYLNYDFWSNYPYVAYVIVSNRPFLVRYPRITLVVYGYDGWFIGHPFIAREVYRNYVIFNRYPDLYHRYYRHREWLHRHPGVMKIACGNRELIKAHPGYLGEIYKYRREAIKNHHIPPRHMKKMYTSWKSDPRHDRNYRPARPNKEWKLRPDQPRGKKPDRSDDRDRGSRSGKQGGGTSDKLINRGEKYRPDKEFKRGAAPARDKKNLGGKEGGRGSGTSNQLIRRGMDNNPDRGYRRGIVPSPDKKVINPGGMKGSGRQDGPREGGARGKGGGEGQRK